jgi:hypothetical protein
MTSKRTIYRVQIRVGAAWETQSEWSSRDRAAAEEKSLRRDGEEARVVEVADG